MATLVASVTPCAPNIEMYPYEIKHAKALPQGAAEMAVIAFSPPVGMIGLVGKKGSYCGATQIGPTPGPPPPCGMANVLCKFR